MVYTYNATGGTIKLHPKYISDADIGFVGGDHVYCRVNCGRLERSGVMRGDTTSTVSSVIDSTGNTYALTVGSTKVTGLTSASYYAKNIAGGSNTVTVKFNATASLPNMNVLE